MNPVFLTIGGFEIRYYGLMYAIAFIVGTELGKFLAKKRGVDPKLIDTYAFVAMVSGLLGGRLYYVLFNIGSYLDRPLEIFAVWQGGLAIHGGIIGGIIGTLIFAKKHKLSPWLLGDLAAMPLLLGQALGRIGNFANGEIHGVPTYTPLRVIFSFKPKFYEWYESYQAMSLEMQIKFKELVPWGMVFPTTSAAGAEFPGEPLHPAMLYELVLNLVGVVILATLFRKNKFTGYVWWNYLIIYGVIRIFVSFFRAEDLMLLGLRAPHLISLILIGIGSVMLYSGRKQSD